MSSSLGGPLSSPLGGGTGRRKSRFTYKHLAQLALSSANCPLRVIGLIDLDAFYAQCETIRLGLPEDQPLAVQQWGGLIAINYACRAHGITRFMDMAEAKRLCSNIRFQHVATWKEGEDRWEYREQSADNVATQKVSLDPYRAQSRAIFGCIRETLPPPPLQRVEKASVDEMFMDLSAQVHSIMLQRFPELAGPPPYNDPTEQLPTPPTTALNWDTDALVDLDEGETEDDDPDWDDVAILIGSEIIRGVRSAIREKLKFTCSAGIARNKMLAKLGAGHNKPNRQTIIRNRAVQQFLSGFKFTKIRNLGGKLGNQVVTSFGTDEVKDLLQVPIEQFKAKLDDDTGSWLYNTIRGEDHSEISSRTQIQSMLSAKSFRPSINDRETAIRWLRIFVADIFLRLINEGVLENRRRPRTMNLHHRQGGVSRSRQLPIPAGATITEAMLLDLATTLLGQVIVDGRAWPCANLSLSVGAFSDGPTGTRGIGSFLIKSDEAKAAHVSLPLQASHGSDCDEENEPARKRPKPNHNSIARFLVTSEDSRTDSEASPAPGSGADAAQEANGEQGVLQAMESAENESKKDIAAFEICQKCHARLRPHETAEHDDWHFAREIQAQERSLSTQTTTTAPQHMQVRAKMKRGRPVSGSTANDKGPAKGQMRLEFGR